MLQPDPVASSVPVLQVREVLWQNVSVDVDAREAGVDAILLDCALHSHTFTTTVRKLPFQCSFNVRLSFGLGAVSTIKPFSFLTNGRLGGRGTMDIYVLLRNASALSEQTRNCFGVSGFFSTVCKAVSVF